MTQMTEPKGFPYRWFGAGLGFCVFFFVYWISFGLETNNPKINNHYLFKIAWFILLFIILVAIPREKIMLRFSLAFSLMSSGFLAVFYFNTGFGLFGWGLLFAAMMVSIYLRVLLEGIFFLLLFAIPVLTLIFSMMNWGWSVHLMKLTPLGLCHPFPSLENGLWFIGLGGLCALLLQFKRHETDKASDPNIG